MRRAILDIGYNAIRTVVYDNENIGSPEILNIKFRNDMLNLLEGESLDIRHQTYLNIGYFLHIFKNLQVEKINCVATEILRNHPRSQEFIDYIKNKFDLEIEVISGQKEAELSALGLMVGIPNANGISVDLGGGSLELVEVNDNKMGNRQSFLLGTKLLKSQNITSQEQIIKEVRSKIWNNNYDNLYFVGGSLRFLARVYIDNNSYIKNLHNLEIPASEMLIFLNNIEESCADNTSLRNQIRSNSGAILIAKSLMSVFNPLKIIISTYGLKEGVRAEQNSFLKQDIILEKTKFNCHYQDDTNFDDYIKVLKELLIGEKDYSLLIKCTIMLLRVKHKFDKTIPPTALTQYIMHSEIPYPHKFRLMLSLAVCYTTNFKPDNNLFYKSKEFLDKEEHSTSQIIGDYLRICEEIDGPVFKTPSFSIEKKGRFLEVQSEYILPRTIFEKVCSRLKSISQSRR